jgi:hypothetical protein
LLDEVGLLPTFPAVPVQVDLSAHRWALVGALRARRDCERYLGLAVEAARARRSAARIEEFMSTAGLEDAQDRRTPGAPGEGSRPVAKGCE